MIGLGALSAATIAIHGYHVGIEDQAIYLAGILHRLTPSLFPHDVILFEAQTRHTILDELVAGLIRGCHMSLDWSLLVLHLVTIFLLLFGAWRVARRCFSNTHAVWAGLAVLTGLFLIPIAGTSQTILNQYLHPTSLSTAVILLPLADFLPGEKGKRRWARYLWVAVCFALAFLLQMQMAVFGLGLIVFLAIPWERWMPAMRMAAFALLPGLFGQLIGPGSTAWQEAARIHEQHYLLRWEWYMWLGIVAPMFLFWWWARLAEGKSESVLAWFCRRLALYGTLVLVFGSALVIPPQFERFTVFQPMRMFTFIYLYMLLVGGGLLGEFVVRKAAWRWLLVFVTISTGMYFSERSLFPASPHIEWPGQEPRNDWASAFLWIRNNTPIDSYFAVNPHYLSDNGNDEHGFRAWAWRSQMADWEKDSGVACLVPDIAPRWHREVHARDHWKDFENADFARLKQEFGVDWAVWEKPTIGGKAGPLPSLLDCPYQNPSVYVCRIR